MMKGTKIKLGDAQAKIIARHKRVIAQILHDYIPEYADVSTDDIVSRHLIGDAEVKEKPVFPARLPDVLPGGSTEDKDPDDGSVYYDLVVNALAPGPDKGTIRIIFNFEIQNDPWPGYPLPMRAEYYAARSISSQYGVEFTESQYGDLKKVYSVWILPYAPASWGNNVLVFPGDHDPKVISGRNHYGKTDYGLWNYIFIEIGSPEKLQENKDAIRLLSLLFSLTMKRQERTDALRREFGFDIGTQEEQELEQMQEMLSINEVYKERMEVEIRLANERAQRAEDQARRAEDQARAAKAQNILAYIESGLQFGADSDVLVQAVRKKYGLSHQDAVLQVDAVRQQRLSPSD